MCSNDGQSKCGRCGGYHHSDVGICKCLPYNDIFMITAQIVSIMAIIISFIWWVTFLVGAICFVLLQVIWCCRQSKVGLYITAGVSTVAAITSVIAGIIMLVSWKDQSSCAFWRLILHDKWYNTNVADTPETDYCRGGMWAVVAFATAMLWFTTAGCILYFVKSGRHTKWEEKLHAIDTDTTTTPTTTTTTKAIEMGTVQHQHQHHHHHDDDYQQQEKQSAIAIATTSATTVAATSYVLSPDIPYKMGDV